jgi:hypothetical protein
MERAKMMQGVQACARLIMNYECVFTYCVCVFLTTSSEGLPSDAIPIAGRIHPPQRLQCHIPVRHPISLPLGRS